MDNQKCPECGKSNLTFAPPNPKGITAIYCLDCNKLISFTNPKNNSDNKKTLGELLGE